MAGSVTSLAIPPDTDPVLGRPGLVGCCATGPKAQPRPRPPVGAPHHRPQGEAALRMAELVETQLRRFFSQANTPSSTPRVLPVRHAVRRHLRLPRLAAAPPYLAGAALPAMAKSPPPRPDPAFPASARSSRCSPAPRPPDRFAAASILSSGESLDLIEQARNDGVDVDVPPSPAPGRHGHRLRFNPPLPRRRPCAASATASRSQKPGPTAGSTRSARPRRWTTTPWAPFSESEPGTHRARTAAAAHLKWAAEHKLPLIDAVARITSEGGKIAGIAKGVVTFRLALAPGVRVRSRRPSAHRPFHA